MLRSGLSSTSIAVALACLLVACRAETVPESPSRGIDPRALYPLGEDNAWSYDVDTGERSTTLAVTRVESFDGRTAVVRTADTLVRYEVLPEGIRLLSEDAWLFRLPLEVGASWPAPGDRSGQWLSLDASLETAAGRFDACVEVLERGGKLDLEVRTVYCPGVGPVVVTSTMRSRVGERTLTVTARLRGYQVSPLPALPR